MSRLDEIMTNVGLPALRKQFGDDAVYTPPDDGSPVTTWAMMGTSVELVGQYSPVAETRKSAVLPIADVPDPRVGASLVVNSVTYRVGQILVKDSYTVTVALT